MVCEFSVYCTLFYTGAETAVRSRGGKGNCGGGDEVLLGTGYRNRQHSAKMEVMEKGSGAQQKSNEMPDSQEWALVSD